MVAGVTIGGGGGGGIRRQRIKHNATYCCHMEKGGEGYTEDVVITHLPRKELGTMVPIGCCYIT
jgi:hypothetical protein